MNLRKLAEGKSCLIRIPQFCVDRNIVLCHLRMIGISGAGMKAPDLLAAYGCPVCHDICDSRVPSDFTYAEKRLFLLEGIARTQYWLISEGYLTW